MHFIWTKLFIILVKLKWLGGADEIAKHCFTRILYISLVSVWKPVETEEFYYIMKMNWRWKSKRIREISRSNSGQSAVAFEMHKCLIEWVNYIEFNYFGKNDTRGAGGGGAACLTHFSIFGSKWNGIFLMSRSVKVKRDMEHVDWT